jgi:hypothetical protein
MRRRTMKYGVVIAIIQKFCGRRSRNSGPSANIQKFCDSRSRNSGMNESELLVRYQVLVWGKQRSCGRSRNSGIGALGHTEILWSFQKFWTRCFGSYRDSVVIPEILDSVLWVIQRFCGRSRNSGIGALRVKQRFCRRSRNSGIGSLGHTEIL